MYFTQRFEQNGIIYSIFLDLQAKKRFLAEFF